MRLADDEERGRDSRGFIEVVTKGCGIVVWCDVKWSVSELCVAIVVLGCSSGGIVVSIVMTVMEVVVEV